ncbi:hypothetical protein RRG08_043395 [Elysia crispata]|uniref:Uncharacterized protein n=1 Tax=Elysia crispata TaxID=231223 RepID=A0AAE1ATL4_9GAST|nr:hypothetical protein RRG08_043395 [Elysia crispata]
MTVENSLNQSRPKTKHLVLSTECGSEYPTIIHSVTVLLFGHSISDLPVQDHPSSLLPFPTDLAINTRRKNSGKPAEIVLHTGDQDGATQAQYSN